MSASVRVPRTRLTEHEIEVLSMVALGSTNATIARRFGVSEEVVKRRLRDIRLVLGASDRAHAVNEGWRQGYLGRSRSRRAG